MGGILTAILLSIVLALIVSNRTKINPGILTFSLAFVFGRLFLDIPYKQLLAMAPLSLILNIFSITYLYGFSVENGTADALVRRVIRPFANRPYTLPAALYVISFLFSAAGRGPFTGAIVGPIAFGLSRPVGQDPVLTYVAVYFGGGAGSHLITSFGGRIIYSMIADNGFAQQATAYTNRAFLQTLLIYTVIFAVLYALYGGVRYAPRELSLEEQLKTVPFTPEQRKTLWIIGGSMVFMVAASVISGMENAPAAIAWVGKLEISTICLFGGVAAHLLRVADPKVIMKKRIAWNLVLVFFGMSTLMAVAMQTGFGAMLAEGIQGNLPRRLIVPGFVLIAGVISFFSSAYSVVLPLLYPIVGVVSASTGVDPGTLFSMVVVTAIATGSSPFSNGGGTLLAAYPQPEERERLVYRLLPLPAVAVAVCFVFGLIMG